jgi:hypothetical protein
MSDDRVTPTKVRADWVPLDVKGWPKDGVRLKPGESVRLSVDLVGGELTYAGVQKAPRFYWVRKLFWKLLGLSDV